MLRRSENTSSLDVEKVWQYQQYYVKLVWHYHQSWCWGGLTIPTVLMLRRFDNTNSLMLRRFDNTSSLDVEKVWQYRESWCWEGLTIPTVLCKIGFTLPAVLMLRRFDETNILILRGFDITTSPNVEKVWQYRQTWCWRGLTIRTVLC